MYEFLPPLLRYGLLVLLYLFVFVAYLGLVRALRSPAPAPAERETRPVAASLVVVATGASSRARKGQHYPLFHDTRIGRGKECTIFLEDEFASKNHALVFFDGGSYILSDAGSRNGTFLNGQPISQPTELVSGDRIEIGSTVFEFREG